MANYTQNLNLYKIDPLKDGNETFNINTILNDNWDKIDIKNKQQETRVNQNKDKTIILRNDIGDKSALNTTDKSNLVSAVNEVSASMADIANKQGNLTTLRTTEKGNIVGALNEVFQNADNGKTNIYNAIVGKGTTPTSKDFNDLVSAINSISTGKKVAEGHGHWEQDMHIRGLDFSPRYIIVYLTNYIGENKLMRFFAIGIINNDINWGPNDTQDGVNGRQEEGGSDHIGGQGFTFLEDGFDTRVPYNYKGQFKWIAIE